MSLSEFDYPLMQAWDWWKMYKSQNVQVQIGGSDQLGNIVAGAKGLKYMRQTNPLSSSPTGKATSISAYGPAKSAMAFTVPLLTTQSGEKFGKSAGNAVWLDPTMTTPFDLYKVCL